LAKVTESFADNLKEKNIYALKFCAKSMKEKRDKGGEYD
jgi:hypothetical protein